MEDRILEYADLGVHDLAIDRSRTVRVRLSRPRALLFKDYLLTSLRDRGTSGVTGARAALRFLFANLRVLVRAPRLFVLVKFYDFDDSPQERIRFNAEADGSVLVEFRPRIRLARE